MARNLNSLYNRKVAKLSRNDACSCGSGLKYKRCCLGKTPILKGRRMLWSGLVGLGALGAAVTLSILYGLKTGLGAGAALLLVACILFAILSPPSGSGRGGASDINFGR